MKKSRIFMSLGALTLVIAGVLATKANKKTGPYAGPIYYTSSGTFFELVGGTTCLKDASLLTITGGTSVVKFAPFGLSATYTTNTATANSNHTLYY